MGRHHGRVPYARIVRVRLSFRPQTMQGRRFVTEVWPAGGPRLTIASASWRSVLDQAAQDEAYGAFVRELHARLAAAGSAAVFDAGSPPLLYWPGLACSSRRRGARGAAVHALATRQWTGPPWSPASSRCSCGRAATSSAATGRPATGRTRCRASWCRADEADPAGNRIDRSSWPGLAPAIHVSSAAKSRDGASVAERDGRRLCVPACGGGTGWGHCARICFRLRLNASSRRGQRALVRCRPHRRCRAPLPPRRG